MFVLTSFVSPVSYIAEYAPLILPITAAQKNGSSISGLPGQLYTKFKAAYSCIYFGFSQKQQTNKSMRYYSCQNVLTKNLFSKSSLPCAAIYKIQSCTPLYLFWLLPETTNKQICEVWFLPESAYQKSFSKIWAFLYSYIQNSKLHTFVFILASLRNKKQTNLWGMIHFSQNLGFLCNYIQNSIAAHSCMYFSFSQKQETNKSIGYYSYQNLLTKKYFSKIWACCGAVYKIKSRMLLIYFGFFQE